jgi:hypothetical protein
MKIYNIQMKCRNKNKNNKVKRKRRRISNNLCQLRNNSVYKQILIQYIHYQTNNKYQLLLEEVIQVHNIK